MEIRFVKLSEDRILSRIVVEAASHQKAIADAFAAHSEAGVTCVKIIPLDTVGMLVMDGGISAWRYLYACLLTKEGDDAVGELLAVVFESFRDATPLAS